MNKDIKILITGGKGFLGNCVVDQLKRKGYSNLIIFSSKEYDLTKEDNVLNLFNNFSPVDIVIHLAGDTGGIGYNRSHPGSTYYKNIMVNTLVQEYAKVNKVKKFIGIGSVCSYPKFTELPFKENKLWDGYPEETNAPYGLAKRMMLVQSKAYRQEYNFNGIHLLMINLYGPNDNFNPDKSHAIAALIKKFIEAKKDDKSKVVLWGDGSPSREFLYVEEAAEAIVLAMEKYNSPEPINIGSGQEIKIKDLANLIKEIVGYDGKIEWDVSKPNGQPRRSLDIEKARIKLGFKPKISLVEGITRTIEWYKRRYN